MPLSAYPGADPRAHSGTYLAYLDRIGVTEESLHPLDGAALRRLVEAHAARIPFENTRIHHGEPISVDLDEILDRLVRRGEGGVCYELNGALSWLLRELGAEVELDAAEVLAGPANPKAVPLPMGHLALVVRLPGQEDRRLVDVGFGGEALLRPAPSDGEVVITARGSSYRIDRRPRQLGDFAGMAWWHSTSPGSRFVRSVVISSTRPDGITTLSGSAPDSGGGELRYRFRGTTEAEGRDVSRGEAQRLAEGVFGIAALPSRLVEYRPRIDAD